MKAIADIRRTLHEHPGVSNHEEFAHDLIISELAQLKPTRVHDHVGGYGVVAVWGEKPSAPTVAFRADNDALPIGHRCGHDGHTSILLRLARLVDANPPKDGNVLLLWQPAEETGEGSQRVIDSGILQQYNIKAMFGLHNLPGFDEGCTVLAHRTFAAASTGVVYHFEGRETHASTPELGVNPGLAVAALIERILAMNSHRSIDDFRQATLICVELGQPAFGTSAGSADVMFTLRAFTNDAMQQLMAQANDAASQLASQHGLKLSQRLVEPFDATENDDAMVELVEEEADECQYVLEPFRWSEDFGRYLRLFRGAMFGVGAGRRHPELHHPDYDFPDVIIEPAAQLFLRLAKRIVKF